MKKAEQYRCNSAEGTDSKKVGSETKALFARLQANSQLELDLFR